MDALEQSKSSSQSYWPPLPSKTKQQRAKVMLGMLILMLCCTAMGAFWGYTTATSNSNALWLAGQHATATAQMRVIAATATSVSSAPNPYVPGAKLVLSDPLNWPGVWQPDFYAENGRDMIAQCQFLGIGYQISISQPGFNPCDEKQIYRDFIFEVKMTINEGDCGGIMLRSTDNDFNMYRFTICQDGSYTFFTYISTDPSATKPIILKDSSSPAIHQGSEENVLAVVAHGSQMDLYVNGREIDSIIDGSHTQGTLGLTAQDLGHMTTVTYRDARVWVI